MEYENEEDCTAQMGSRELLQKADFSLHPTGNIVVLLIQIIM